ncbi:MAG: hypothetical protein ACHP65_07910 [Legionellales bacterium]
MAVHILYHDAEDEIRFTCPNDNCPVRNQLITNLNKSGIAFEDKGTDILVKLIAFSSTDDIAEKAFAGFSEIDNFKGYEHYDHTGTVMSFGYDWVIPEAKKEASQPLMQNMHAAMRRYPPDDRNDLSQLDGIRSQIEALEESGKDLLDAHYRSLRASAHHR